jgi:hypothetical protein
MKRNSLEKIIEPEPVNPVNCPECTKIRLLPLANAPNVYHRSIIIVKVDCDFCKNNRIVNWIENVFGVNG